MCPEKAKVFIAEDDDGFREMVIERLEEGEHKVVAFAKTFKEAKELAPRLEELGVQVAILDGNLSPNETEGREGQTILRIIKEKSPRVKTVGISAGYIQGVDIDLGKKRIEKLVEIVDKI